MRNGANEISQQCNGWTREQNITLIMHGIEEAE